MAEDVTITKCRYCASYSSQGNYCSNCGQPCKTSRITLHTLLHDVFHYFTHFEKGFGFTLKKLITSPGTMQREYIEGYRGKHQKPFSMFVICATLVGLFRYFLFTILVKFYHSGDAAEARFFHEYMVMLYVALVPLNVLITWLLFYKSGYNYAEIGVLTLYTISAFFLSVGVIGLLKFIWPNLDTAYIELPVLTIYNIITFIHFFNKSPRWIVIIKSIILLVAFFLMSQYFEEFVMKRIVS